MGTWCFELASSDRGLPHRHRIHRDLSHRRRPGRHPAVVHARGSSPGGRDAVAPQKLRCCRAQPVSVRAPGRRRRIAAPPAPPGFVAGWRRDHQRQPPVGSAGGTRDRPHPVVPARRDRKGPDHDLPGFVPGGARRRHGGGRSSHRSCEDARAAQPRTDPRRRRCCVPDPHLPARSGGFAAAIRSVRHDALHGDGTIVLCARRRSPGDRCRSRRLRIVRPRLPANRGLARPVRQLRRHRLPNRPGPVRHGIGEPHWLRNRARTSGPDPGGDDRLHLRGRG